MENKKVAHIKKDDTVYIMSGGEGKTGDKGKKGKVLKVLSDKGMVLVEGVNMSTKHKKPRGRYEQGGIIHQESPIYASKAMLVCPKCGERTRVEKQKLDDGHKVRVCKRCKEFVDNV
ncbi:MAG: 50S ribosomal protein L24 [Bacillota bacterium]|nr:50S ribosomal protein L24 [Bacillota bacterium]